MSLKIIENYFMRVGRSYYRSTEFEAERQRLREAGIELEATSQFGIGILSCFMVADRFEVETYRVGSNPLHLTVEGPTKYFVLRSLDEPPRSDFPLGPSSALEDGPPGYPGTRITVHLRPDTKFVVADVLSMFAVNIEYDISVHYPHLEQPETIFARQWDVTETRAQDFFDTAGREEYGMFDNEWWALKEDYELVEGVDKSLDEVMVPSWIQFQKYDFPRHLRGCAWLWLLRDVDGSVCPSRGHLFISDTLSLSGLPVWVGIATRMFGRTGSEGWKHLIKDLRAYLKATAAEFRQSEGYRILSASSVVDSLHFINDWYSLSIEDRAIGCRSLEAYQLNSPSWYSRAGVPKQLLEGTNEWASDSVDFSDRNLALNALPQKFALHGIQLPAGLVRWDPMIGSARKIRLLGTPGGMRIDSRGPNAPTPAASRLFVEMGEAKKIAIPFARAAIHHAFDVINSQQQQERWFPWLGQFFRSIEELYFWPEAIYQELEFIEQFHVFPILSDREHFHLEYKTRAELINTYGRWIPASNNFAGNIPSLWFDDISKCLLVFRNKRRRSGGIWEIDMQSSIRRESDTIEDLWYKWSDEIESDYSN
jgi:hypothetical protein